MNVWIRVLLLSLGFALIASASWGGAEEAAEPVAVVSELSGTAWATPPDGARSPVERFDWLLEGTRVDVETESSLTIAFADGRRVRFERAS